jgi:hypothetical protein
MRMRSSKKATSLFIPVGLPQANRDRL